MSQYYQSNSPYNRAHQQQDGLANGAIIGGMMGAGAMGATQMYGGNAMQSRAISGVERQRAARKNMRGIENRQLDEGFTQEQRRAQLGEQERKLSKAERRTENAVKGRNLINDKLGKGGNWKSRAIAYGGSALAGMGAGAGLDALNK